MIVNEVLVARRRAAAGATVEVIARTIGSLIVVTFAITFASFGGRVWSQFVPESRDATVRILLGAGFLLLLGVTATGVRRELFVVPEAQALLPMPMTDAARLWFRMRRSLREAAIGLAILFVAYAAAVVAAHKPVITIVCLAVVTAIAIACVLAAAVALALFPRVLHALWVVLFAGFAAAASSGMRPEFFSRAVALVPWRALPGAQLVETARLLLHGNVGAAVMAFAPTLICGIAALAIVIAAIPWRYSIAAVVAEDVVRFDRRREAVWPGGEDAGAPNANDAVSRALRARWGERRRGILMLMSRYETPEAFVPRAAPGIVAIVAGIVLGHIVEAIAHALRWPPPWPHFTYGVALIGLVMFGTELLPTVGRFPRVRRDAPLIETLPVGAQEFVRALVAWTAAGVALLIVAAFVVMVAIGVPFLAGLGVIGLVTAAAVIAMSAMPSYAIGSYVRDKERRWIAGFLHGLTTVIAVVPLAGYVVYRRLLRRHARHDFDCEYGPRVRSGGW